MPCNRLTGCGLQQLNGTDENATHWDMGDGSRPKPTHFCKHFNSTGTCTCFCNYHVHSTLNAREFHPRGEEWNTDEAQSQSATRGAWGINYYGRHRWHSDDIDTAYHMQALGHDVHTYTTAAYATINTDDGTGTGNTAGDATSVESDEGNPDHQGTVDAMGLEGHGNLEGAAGLEGMGTEGSVDLHDVGAAEEVPATP